ncbi:MAG TPA: methyltransferase domain-containing protein [Polyangiales bacterium]|nr:methyltransferase domain-containing protein [Polyangiales bacterium]
MQCTNENPEVDPRKPGRSGSAPPSTAADFDRAYGSPITFWGDIRIPKELKALARLGSHRLSLELGCGVGRFSRYLAKQGVRATAVDFSAVAIAKAREAAAHDDAPPEYLVGDVTRLDGVSGPFDFAFDIGCFHCLDAAHQKAYVAEVFRVLAPGGTHLIWALDASPSDVPLAPETMRALFAPEFELQEAKASRRRLVRSHWYWLRRV